VAEAEVLRIEPGCESFRSPGVVNKRVAARSLARSGGGWALELAAEAAALVCVEPRPRVAQVEAGSPVTLRLTVELSRDLDRTR
jgi:hypothetical protein